MWLNRISSWHDHMTAEKFHPRSDLMRLQVKPGGCCSWEKSFPSLWAAHTTPWELFLWSVPALWTLRETSLVQARWKYWPRRLDKGVFGEKLNFLSKIVTMTWDVMSNHGLLEVRELAPGEGFFSQCLQECEKEGISQLSWVFYGAGVYSDMILRVFLRCPGEAPEFKGVIRRSLKGTRRFLSGPRLAAPVLTSN